VRTVSDKFVEKDEIYFIFNTLYPDHLCGQVVRVPGYRPRGPGLISGATRFSEK
jgi:hypothetical protein